MGSHVKKTGTVFAAALMLCSMAGCGKTKEPRSTDAIIEDIITQHGCYGDQADEKVSELLGELTEQDSRQGKSDTTEMIVEKLIRL